MPEAIGKGSNGQVALSHLATVGLKHILIA